MSSRGFLYKRTTKTVPEILSVVRYEFKNEITCCVKWIHRTTPPPSMRPVHDTVSSVLFVVELQLKRKRPGSQSESHKMARNCAVSFLRVHVYV